MLGKTATHAGMKTNSRVFSIYKVMLLSGAWDDGQR